MQASDRPPSLVQYPTIGEISPIQQGSNLFRFSGLCWSSNCQCVRHENSCWRVRWRCTLVNGNPHRPDDLGNRLDDEGSAFISACPRPGRQFLGSSGGTDARINSHSRNKSLSREHHVDHGRHALCRAPRGRWNCPRQTSHTGEHDFRSTGRVRLALDFGSFCRRGFEHALGLLERPERLGRACNGQRYR